MENKDSNIKSQQTGGLKLMTVFIAVLALHVVVIGGFTAYHLMSGGSPDSDMTASDKSHKDAKPTDNIVTTDATSPAITTDKPAATATTTAPAASTDASTAPSTTTVTPTTDQTPTTGTATPTSAPAPTTSPATAPNPAPISTIASTTTVAPPITPTPNPTLAPAPTLTLNAPKAALLTPPADTTTMAQVPAPLAPISPQLAPPTEPQLSSSAPTGPVHMPSVASAPAAPKVEHEHMPLYTVKITDSYKKIAKAHHISVAQLKEANHIKGDTLHTGQKLRIPSSNGIVATTASSNGTESVPTRTVLNQSSTASLAAAPASEETGKHHHFYTVTKGDTLVKIAHKFKTTPLAIMEVNDISDPAKLTIGKKLKIPSREASSAKATPVQKSQPSEVQAKEKAVSGQLANFVP